MSLQPQEEEVVFRIKRYSPEKGSYWQEYKLKVDRYTQVVEALRRIKSEQDPTLAYRAACHMAVCGSCGMKINGEPRLACKTNILEMVKKYGSNVITIEPMDYFKPVKDLVVDLDDFYQRMYKVEPRLHTHKEVLEGKAEHRLKPEDQRELWKFGQCIWCGLCVSACPVVPIDSEFLGPAPHAKGYRFLADPRDTITEERLKILLDSAWRCTYCYMCYEVCPREIEPVTAIKKTRAYTKLAKEKTPVTMTGEKHIESIHNSLIEVGKLDEAKVYLGTYGLLGSIRDFIYLFQSGKVKYALVKERPVENISEIRKILTGESK